jgi:hypothetical protein
LLRLAGKVRFPFLKKPEHNRHVGGQIDHWAELDSPKLKVKLYQMPARELVTRVEVSDTGITLANGAHVGMPATQVKALLGTPDVVKDRDLVDEAHVGMDASVTFHTTNEAVDRIVWEFEID